MASIHHQHPGILLLYICAVTAILLSKANGNNLGVVSQSCSSFSWFNASEQDHIVLLQDVPVPIYVTLLDQLCEDYSCADAGVGCQVGNCSICVPITQDYSKTIYFSAENVKGSGSEPLSGTVTCTVGPQDANNPGNYNGTCTSANKLVLQGNLYALWMNVMDHANQTLLARIPQPLMFGAGTPSVPNLWAEFEQPPIGIYHKNMIRIWLRDFMNNTICDATRHTWDQPVQLKLDVTTWDGAPAKLIIPPALDENVYMGYYFAPVAPMYTGDYIAFITVGDAHIANSPLYFTVGKTYGIPTRTPSSSTPLILATWLSYLLMLCSSAVALTSLLKG